MSLQKVRALSAKVDGGLSNAFRSLAEVITNRPWLTICATMLLGFALAPGLVIGGAENDGEKLWVPQDTESKVQVTWVRSTFKGTDRRARVYSSNNDLNLLTQESLVALQKLQDGIMSVTAACEEGTCVGKTVEYNDVRVKQRRSLLSIWEDRAPPAGTNILADVNDQMKWKSTDGATLKLTDMLGGVTYDSDGKITGAQCFLTSFLLKNERELVGSKKDKSVDPWSSAWEMALDDFVQPWTDAHLAKNQPWTIKGQAQAGGDAITGDIAMLSMGYVLLIGFSIIVMSSHKRVESNGAMAMASVFAVVLSIMSTFGLCGYIGVKTNPVTTTMYLVLLGIGVDDAYVIMGEYQHAKGLPQERVIQALTKAGTSIAVTSMTDVVAFGAGMTASLPALRDFCIFGSIGIFWCFFYQCTFFVAVLLLRARGSANNHPDWLCCITVDPESTGCFACSGPICSRNGQCVCCPCTTTSAEGESEGVTKRCLRKVTNVTMTPIGTVVVGIVTVGLLAGALAGVPKLKVDFDLKWFTPTGHAYDDTYKAVDKYFPQAGGVPVYVYTKSGDYATAHSDGSLAAVYQRMEEGKWIDRNIGNWYTELVKDTGRSTRSKASNAAFASEAQTFVTTAAGGRFAKDIVFTTDSNGVATGISGARAAFLSYSLKDGEDQIDLTKTTRASVNGQPLGAFPFFTAFLYFDGNAVVGSETIQNILIACVCVFIVNLVMLADFFAAALVLLMIGLVDICILGYMAHWGLDFNSVTAINLVLAVGLAVDYSAHIAHSFLVEKGPGVERAKKAVDHIGYSVFNGGLSTFLAIMPLGLGKSYVFGVFFKMWFMIIIFGLYFGVIVLPILLRFLSPCIGAEQGEATADGPGSTTKDVLPNKDETIGKQLTE